MDGRMDKKQVIQTTIGVLSEISVPVRLKAQIADPIDGAINNLAIVLQMIQMEEEANANARRQEEEPELGHTMSTSHPRHIALLEFEKYVEEKTEGKEHE